MQLNIKYFGLLAEITDRSEESLDFKGATSHELLQQIIAKYPELKSKDFQLAHNKEIVTEDIKITHPEIALLPPFSGG